MDNFFSFFKKHKWAILFILLGILLTYLILTLNIWRTLVLVVIVLICFFIGHRLDAARDRDRYDD